MLVFSRHASFSLLYFVTISYGLSSRNPSLLLYFHLPLLAVYSSDVSFFLLYNYCTVIFFCLSSFYHFLSVPVCLCHSSLSQSHPRSPFLCSYSDRLLLAPAVFLFSICLFFSFLPKHLPPSLLTAACVPFLTFPPQHPPPPPLLLSHPPALSVSSYSFCTPTPLFFSGNAAPIHSPSTTSLLPPL